MSTTQRTAVDSLVKRHSSKSQRDATRAALARNPQLADHYVALRLQGRSKVDHQIVHAVLARSGTTGMQRLAMCESALRQIQHLGPSQRADVMGLVTTGSSVHAAVARVRGAVADIKAEAAAKSQQSMAHKLDAAVKSLQHEAAHWKNTADAVNALYRKVPVMTRTAEAATGFFGATATVGDVAVGELESTVTVNGSHFSEAVDNAARAGGHMAGELNDKVGQARTLYLQFSRQHIAYVEQNHRMQRAIRNGDFKTQTDARARMDKLAVGMKATVARFRPTAEKAIRMDHQFDNDTRVAIKHVMKSAVLGGLGEVGESIESVEKGMTEGLLHAMEDAVVGQTLDKTAEVAHKAISNSE